MFNLPFGNFNISQVTNAFDVNNIAIPDIPNISIPEIPSIPEITPQLILEKAGIPVNIESLAAQAKLLEGATQEKMQEALAIADAAGRARSALAQLDINQIGGDLTSALSGVEGNLTSALSGLSGVEGNLTSALSGLSGLSGVGGNLTSALSGVQGNLTSALSGVEGNLTSALSGLSGVEGNLTSALSGVQGNLTSALSGVEGNLTSALSGLSGVGGNLTSALSGVQGNLTSALSGVGGDLTSALSGVGGNLTSALSGLSGVGGNLTSALSGIGGGLSGLTGGLSGLTGGLSGLTGGLGGLTGGLGGLTGGLGGSGGGSGFKSLPALSYPSDTGSDNVKDYIVFIAYSSEVAGYTKSTTISSPAGAEPEGTVQLYIPENLAVSSQVGYQNTSGGSLTASAMNLYNADGDFLDKMAALTAQISGQALQQVNESAAVAAQAAAVGDGPGSVGVGAANRHVLFEGVDFRTFSYAYEFLPKSWEESVRLKEIIKFFRVNMLPEVRDNGNTFRPPNWFSIEYMIDGKPTNYLNKIKPSVCTGCDVSYGGNGQFAMFQSDKGEDPAPALINLTLTFQEVQLVSKVDAQEGY